jgi:hypothetical protein
MQCGNLYVTETSKPVTQFVRDLGSVAKNGGL